MNIANRIKEIIIEQLRVNEEDLYQMHPLQMI